LHRRGADLPGVHGGADRRGRPWRRQARDAGVRRLTFRDIERTSKVTSFDGETAASVSDELLEAADPAVVIADEAAESLEGTTAAEAVEDAPLDSGDEDAEPAPVAAADDEVAPDAPAEDEEEDPAVALKKDLRLRPGEWYVIHSYAGYENKV